MISISIDLVSPHALLFGDGMWTKYTVSFSDFAVAGATATITMAALPAKRVLLAVCIKHGTAFTGGALTGYTLQVGNASASSKYASAFSVITAPTSSNAQLSSGAWCEDFVAPTNVTVTATATGGLLNAATQGTAEIWLYTTDMP